MADKDYIADKQTQDEIKQETDKIQSVKDDTNYIRNQFPINSGTDFSKIDVKKSSANSRSENKNHTILSITGKGILFDLKLTARNVSTSTNITEKVIVKITIDGMTFLNETYSLSGRKDGEPFEMNYILPYSDEIKIEANPDSSSVYASVSVIYGLYGGEA